MDRPRIITKDTPQETPEELAERIIVTAETIAAEKRHPQPNGNQKGKYDISRGEAVSIATQIGQQVYDRLRAEHAESMGRLERDLAVHFTEIKNVVAVNILDLQRRSFSYRIRRDFAVDVALARAWIQARRDLLLCYAAAWLPFNIDVPTELLPVVSKLEGFTDGVDEPVSPVVARELTLSSSSNPEQPK